MKTLRLMAAALLISALSILSALLLLGFSPEQVAEMFSHPVRGGTRVESASPVAPSPAATAPSASPGRLAAIDYAVVGIYLAGMLGIGIACRGTARTVRSFFLADGALHYVAVGVSILATYLSALTMMALPGMAFGKHDWTYMVQLPFLVVTAAVITTFVLPRYREAGAVSIYSFLEGRIGAAGRTIAAASFVVFAVGRMGLVLYLPALAFSEVSGVSLPLCIVAMGVVVTAYTVVGGMAAVVWTDVVQAVVFVAGAALTLAYVFRAVSPEQFLAVGMAHNKFRVVAPSLDATRITTLWLILETLFQTIRIYGTQQDIAQRYLATESTEKANRSVWIGIVGYIPLGFLFYFLGTALFVFYQAHPDAGLPGKPDSIYPHFVVHYLPSGVAGLVIAAIFAAAMSSIDSCMNSASAVCVEDFLRRLGRGQRSDAACVRVAQALTVLWGALAIGMGLLFRRIEFAQIVWGKLMGICTNGILGLMALAFLPFRVRSSAAIAGFAAAYACLFWMMHSGLNFLLWPVLGNSVCFLVALAAQGGMCLAGRPGKGTGMSSTRG